MLNLKSEILEPIHDVALELSEIDKLNNVHQIKYTELDVIAATVVFIHVLANQKAHYYVNKDETTDSEIITEEMQEYGKRIYNIVEDMTGIDVTKGD